MVSDRLRARTDNSEINFHIPCRRVAKVDAASIDALVRRLDVVYEQLGGMGGGAEVGPVCKGGRRRPQFRLGHISVSHIEAEREQEQGIDYISGGEQWPVNLVWGMNLLTRRRSVAEECPSVPLTRRSRRRRENTIDFTCTMAGRRRRP